MFIFLGGQSTENPGVRIPNSNSLIGINYTLPDLHELFVEFYYNEEGYSKEEWSDFFNMLKFANKDTNTYGGLIGNASSYYNATKMSKYYLFFRLAKRDMIIDKLDYSIYAVVNTTDWSFSASLDVKYTFFNMFSYNTNIIWFYGKKESEFGISDNHFSFLNALSFYF